MKTKNEVEIRAGQISLRDNESRTVCGYAVRYDSDSVDLGFTERIMRGAITDETIKNSDILALLNHDEQKVLARCRYGSGSMRLEAREDGLYYEFEAPKTAAGEELLEQLRRNEITASSFAFTVMPSADNERWYRGEDGAARRDIYHIERLYDCSPVYFPAYEMTSCSKRSLEELTEEEQKEVDELKNELVAVHEEVQAVAEELKDAENQKVEEKSEEEEPKTEETPDENPAEPAEEPKTEEKSDDEETEEKPEESAETEDEKPADEATEDNNEEKSEETDEEDDKDEQTRSSVKINKENQKTTNISMKKNKFNLVKAIRAAAFGGQMDAVTNAVIEEGRKDFRNAGRNYSGQIVLPGEERAITVATEHDDTVEVEFQSLLKPLFENKVLGNARHITGLVGDIKYPIISKTNAGAAWEGEVTKNDESTNTFDSLTLSPHRLSTTIFISKQFLMQESIGAEQAIKDLLLESLAQKLEKTFLSAAAADNTGGKNIPAGLFNGVTADTVKDFEGLCEFEGKAVENCYDLDKMKYLLNPKAWSTIRGTFVYPGKHTAMVMEGNDIDGRGYDISQNFGAANSKTIGLVSWGDIVVAEWGGTELLIDANSVEMARTAQVAITLNAWFDCKKLRPEAVQIATIGNANSIDTSIND